MERTKAAIIGSGLIGTDLLIKIHKLSSVLDVGAFVGIDPDSEGLARAREMGIRTTHEGVDGLLKMDDFDEFGVVFDATSAGAHTYNVKQLEGRNVSIVDLTPAAIGPFVIPSVNLGKHIDSRIVNMVTCGGQATIPIVAAISAVSKVHYGEIVASLASVSAGPGTRANIDEFTKTTANAIEQVGGATRGKAIIILNPASPPMIMRDTVICHCDDADHDSIRNSVKEMVKTVQTFVPGYRMTHEVQIEALPADTYEGATSGLKVSVFLEVEGAGHHLPKYSGNLDIMTSAALAAGEKLTLAKQVEV